MSIHSWKNCNFGGCDDCCSNPDCDDIECEECSLGLGSLDFGTATSARMQSYFDNYDPDCYFTRRRNGQYDAMIYGLDIIDPPSYLRGVDDYIDRLQKELQKAYEIKKNQMMPSAYSMKFIDIKVP